MSELRREAAERFTQMPWPSTSVEEWRRTDVGSLDLLSYRSHPGLSASGGGATGGATGSAMGGVSETLAERGVTILPLSSALAAHEGELRSVLLDSWSLVADRIEAWQFAEWNSGYFVSIPQGVVIEQPIVLEVEGGGPGLLSAPRVVVMLGEGARATIIEHLGAGPEHAGLCNAALDIVLGPGADLGYFEAQELDARALYFRNSRIRLAADARLRHFAAQLGGRLVKTRVDCSLDGLGAEALLDGAYYCGRNQHMDLRTVQRHRARKGMSRANYKGAVDTGGTAVYQGLIDVGTGASGTDAYLASKSLILGDGARSDSLPTLQIGNNDVRCSHGSTTGRLSEEELFYLESRGFSAAAAKEMLVTGYFEELIGSTPADFGERAMERIRGRLAEAA
ncbi:MAG TPA: Fe-S cluster assembly protein SufD [Rectinemataceae bacterium]|nr:Fe-S cluster assembly protein SufD [Rectinemataceae bacterium]